MRALPPVARGYVLVVDALAVLLAVLLVPRDPIGAADLRAGALLTAGALLHIEVARHVERRRELDTVDRPYVDLKSMWSFAAVLTVPLGVALALVLAQWVFWWLRMPTRPLPHRWVFSGAAVVLGSVAAWAVLHALHAPEPTNVAGPLGLAVVVAAALARWSVNHALTTTAVALTAPSSTSWLRRFARPQDAVVGLGALALGVLLHVLGELSPWTLPVLLIPLMAVHRGVMLQQLLQAAHLDDKTGLVTAARWQVSAERALARPRSRRHGLGVLMIDLDEFKQVNDRWGHLAGDRVLRAVADVLADEVRDQDAVGRFGGEEFVVLLRDLDPAAVAGVAERVRRRVTTGAGPVPTAGPAPASEPATDPIIRGLSVSVGVATYPHGGPTLDALLLAADTALYAAKRAGRNRVRAAPAA